MGPDAEPRDYGDITGVEEIAQPLEAFAGVTWTSGTGTLALAFGSESLLVVSKHAVSGVIYVNDAPTAATATTLKKLTITGDGDAETVILDFANGTFAPGITGVNQQGITVAMGAGADKLKIRGGGATADVISMGGSALDSKIAFNIDAFVDITVAGTGTIEYTFSLGGGNDVFNATTTQYGVTGPYAGTAAAAATGTITAKAAAAGVADGNKFIISDGVNPATTFEFDVTGGTAGVTAGNITVSPLAADAADTVVAAAIRTAINGVVGGLLVTAAAGATADVALTNDNNGAIGNVTITQVGSTMTLVGMTGGSGGAGVIVFGGLGDDTLTGSAGSDTLYGDDGVDVLNGGSAAVDSDVFNGGAGSDTVTYASRSAAIDVTVDATADDGEATETDKVESTIEIVQGGSGNDTFTATANKQTFKGGAGNDIFLMGSATSGGDVIQGEAGTDYVSFADRTVAVTVKLDGTATSGEALEVAAINADVENVICPEATATCAVTGSAVDNRVVVGAAACTFTGGAGDDVLTVNLGMGAAHDFKGEAGVDRVDFSSFAATISVTMDYVASTTPTGMKIYTDVENLTCPTGSACTVVGNALNNQIVGSSAADTIDGAGGDDLIESLLGDDAITCGSGSDIHVNSGGTDTNTAADCEL